MAKSSSLMMLLTRILKSCSDSRVCRSVESRLFQAVVNKGTMIRDQKSGLVKKFMLVVREVDRRAERRCCEAGRVAQRSCSDVGADHH